MGGLPGHTGEKGLPGIPGRYVSIWENKMNVMGS